MERFMSWGMLADGFHRRSLVLIAAVTVISGMAGTATALTVDTGTLETQVVSLFSGQTTQSELTIQAYETKFKGKEKIDVSVTIHNPSSSSSAHEGNVTVQLLDANDDLITEATKATDSLDPGTDQDLSYSFSQANLVEQYDETFIIIDQSS